MFKAIALICSVWIVNDKPKQACFTHMFAWQFETKKECQIRLLHYRARELPAYQQIILAECTKVTNL